MRDIRLAPIYLARAFTDSALFKYFIAALVSMSEYLFGTEVTRNAAIAAAGLMLLDTITGAIAAKVAGPGWKSGKFSRVLVKFVSYGSAIIVAAVVTHHLPGMSSLQELSVTTVVSLILCTEALSVLENIDRMGFKGFGWIRKILAGKIEELSHSSENEGGDAPQR